MSLGSDLSIKMDYRSTSEGKTEELINPLAESAKRVDPFKDAILSSRQATIGIAFSIGVFTGDLGGVLLSGLNVPQKIYSFAPVWIGLIAFSAAVSLCVYKTCVVQGCCSKKAEAL